MVSIKEEVEFERDQVVYSVLDPADSFVVRAYVLRKGEPSYLCFSPEYGEMEFQTSEITDQRSVY